MIGGAESDTAMFPGNLRADWLKLCSSNCLQYVTKGGGELRQQARPKRERMAALPEERDDALIRDIQELPAVRLAPPSQTPPQGGVAPTREMDAGVSEEARSERQWRELKVGPGELLGVYARLSKIKLTGKTGVGGFIGPVWGVGAS